MRALRNYAWRKSNLVKIEAGAVAPVDYHGGHIREYVCARALRIATHATYIDTIWSHTIHMQCGAIWGAQGHSQRSLTLSYTFSSHLNLKYMTC